ncbi:hypothetical protein GCM10023080_023990 [Streptomyces pseudoechinosporeus]
MAHRSIDRTWCVVGVNGRTTPIWPGLDSSASGHTASTGKAQHLTMDLRQLGLARAAVRLHADTSPTDGALRTTTLCGSRFDPATAPSTGSLPVPHTGKAFVSAGSRAGT